MAGRRPATIAEELARWTHGLASADVPEEVLAVAKEHALDAIGIGIASSGFDFGEAIHDAAGRLGDGSESRVLAFGTALPAASAALANGTLIHGLDFDDTHIGSIHHATAPVLAAALAVAEAEGATGEELLLAYIIGLEVGCRLAEAGTGDFHDRHFHPTGIMGTFASALVAGRLRGASVEQMTSALGLAGSQAAGILELRESWLKRLHPGWAAHAGIAAMVMATSGFRGPRTVFEGDKGLFSSHLGYIPTREAFGVASLGSRWMTVEIALKPYPCCHFTHGFIDAALAIREEDFDIDEIAEIIAPTSERLIPAVAAPRQLRAEPATIYDALFSIQYAVALALVHGRVDIASFYDEPLDQPAVLAVSNKVVCPVDELSDYPAHFPGEVEVRLRDGRIFKRRVLSSLGTQENAMSRDQVIAKFTANAGRMVGAEQCENITRAVLGLERVPAASQVLDVCAAPWASPRA